jgi:hypothetical protein
MEDIGKTNLPRGGFSLAKFCFAIHQKVGVTLLLGVSYRHKLKL